MRVRIDIGSDDGVLTQRQNADLDDMLCVILNTVSVENARTVESIQDGVYGPDGCYHTGYMVTIPETADWNLEHKHTIENFTFRSESFTGGSDQ